MGKLVNSKAFLLLCGLFLLVVFSVALARDYGEQPLRESIGSIVMIAGTVTCMIWLKNHDTKWVRGHFLLWMMVYLAFISTTAIYELLFVFGLSRVMDLAVLVLSGVFLLSALLTFKLNFKKYSRP